MKQTIYLGGTLGAVLYAMLAVVTHQEPQQANDGDGAKVNTFTLLMQHIAAVRCLCNQFIFTVRVSSQSARSGP